MRVRVLAVGAAVAAVSAGLASAHHSFAMFDNEKEMTIEGVVKEFQWTNPHIWIQVNVAGADGKLVEWSIEGGSPNGLRRNGWSKSSFQPGDKVVMKIHPLKDGSPGGSFMTSTVNGAPLNSRGE